MDLSIRASASKIRLMTGNELKQFREKLGLSQEELAKRLRVAGNTVSRWELGRMKIPEYLDLALETIERRFIEDLADEPKITTQMLRNLAINHPEDRTWINNILVNMGELPVVIPEDDDEKAAN